jgi:CRP/FNR family cyclic AMP-dependent transcriptional regulator
VSAIEQRSFHSLAIMSSDGISPHGDGRPEKQMTLAKTERVFNSHTFLTTVGSGRRMLPFQINHVIFAQGEPSDGLFFIQEGKVQLSVVSEAGKEATLGILGEDDFFGEGGLAGQLVRISSATAMTDCVLLHIEKKAMMLAMSREPKLSATFVKYLLKRNVRYQDDLIDQLFNSSEKRLARILLLMAHFGKEGVVTEIAVPKLSQETLAEMVGTTRSRVSFFMNKFRKLGFLNYDTGHHLRVHSSLLSVVLNDEGGTAAPGAAKLTANGKKALEPPAEPGEQPKKERARRPPLSKPSRAMELNAPK